MMNGGMFRHAAFFFDRRVGGGRWKKNPAKD